jgi:hypothetical protein
MRTSARTVAAAFAAFTLLTLAVFRPTPEELARTSPAFGGMVGDSLLLMWATSHVSRALFSAPLHLFEAGIFYPIRHALAFGDHMIGEALVGLPLWFATRNPLLEYNVLVLLSYAAGATAMFLWAHDSVPGVAPAAAAGIAFVFTPFRFESALWLQVLFTAFMPLALLFWLRFVRTLRWRDWTLWVACWVMHSLMGLYLALYFGITMTALAALALLVAPTRRTRPLRLGTLLGPLATLIAIAPTLWPYVVLRTTQGAVRTAGLDTPLTFFLPGPGTWTARLADSPPHVAFGPGLAVWCLAVVGLVAGRRRGRDPLAWWTSLAGLAITLALVLTPMRVQLAVPGLDMTRATDRAFHVTLVFLALFVALGVAGLQALARSRRARAALGIVLVAAVAADMGAARSERKRIPFDGEIPPAYRALAPLPDRVIYDGVSALDAVALSMYYAIFHGKALPIGYSGFPPAGSVFLRWRLIHFPEDDVLRLLQTLGIRHVLWHFPSPPAVEAFLAQMSPSLSVAGRFENDVVFALADLPSPASLPAVHPLPRAAWRLSASGEGDGLPALVDGARQTAWRLHVERGRAPWLVVDLGVRAPVGGVRCTPTEPDAPGVYFALVELSEDGRRWERMPSRFVPDSLATLLERPARLAYYEARFPARPARFVRLVDPELAYWGGDWAIAELDVLAAEGGE